MPNFDHFDLLAPIYDRVIKPKDPEMLISLARLPVTGVVLDAGGGTGRVASVIRDYASKVVVADLSLKMLEEATLKNGLGAVNTPTELLPFNDGAFERVIMVDSFHHVIDQAVTAGELWRVVKPGGWLIIEEPDIRQTVVKIIALFEKLALMRSHFLPPQRIAELFKFSGAEIELYDDEYSSWVVVHKQAG